MFFCCQSSIDRYYIVLLSYPYGRANKHHYPYSRHYPQGWLDRKPSQGLPGLIEHGMLTPTELADHTSESRTNAYMICEKLENSALPAKLMQKSLPTNPPTPQRSKP